MLVINKEERADKIYTTYEGNCFEFPEYDSALGARVLLHYNETEDKYRATYSQFKKENFISKIRALTKEYEQLPFSQKYSVLALEIENAAKEGKNYIWFNLNEKMIEDLRAEGFTIEDKPYPENCKISW